MLTVVLLLVIIPTVTANQKCPNNLSANCFCTDNQGAVKCRFNKTNVIEIFNASGTSPTLWNLTKLDISQNNLSTLPLNFLDGIFALDELDLSNNNLIQLPNIFQPGLSATIKNLNISHNQFTDINKLTFSSMTALEVLDIANNNLKISADDAFVANKHLWYLDFSNNHLQTLSMQTFKGLENSVRDLDVTNNNLILVEKETFSNLHDLKMLRLSGISNATMISEIDFPDHVALLDLSFSGITDMEDCQLFELTDLEYLNLQGNPLICSCHLVWLNKRMVHNQDVDPIHHIMLSHENNWTCLSTSGKIINVTDFQTDCSDHYFIYTPEHCKQSSDGTNDFNEQTWKENLNLQTVKDKEQVDLEWNGYNSSYFYGYRVTILDKNGQNIYESPTIHPSATKYSAISAAITNGKFQVCLKLLYNETYFIGKACNEVSSVDLQIVVGILAGVIFLIPCALALIYIVCLDKKKFLLYNTYSELSDSEQATQKISTESSENHKGNMAKWAKSESKTDKLKIPAITIQDYTLTSTQRTANILHTEIIPVVHSTERIPPYDQVSIELDGDSGSSAGIRIDLPNESGLTNQGYSEDNIRDFDVKL